MKAEEYFARVDSESGIIATLIRNPDYVFSSENLLPNHFTNVDNRYLYATIYKMAAGGVKTIDAYGIITTLSGDPALSRGAEKITEDSVYAFIENSEGIVRHTLEEYKLLVNNVLDAAFRRDIYQKLKDCEAMCRDETDEDIRRKIYETIDDVMTEYSKNDDIQPYSELVDKMWEEIQRRGEDGYAGLLFKFPALNDYVTIEKGELVIFGAQQKTGKSIMLLNCAVDLLRQGKSVLYIDSELSTRLFTARMLSHLTGIEYRDLTSGHYGDEEKEKIDGALAWLKEQKFTHYYCPFFSTESIYTAVKKVNHTQPIDVLIVDYFKASGDDMDAYATYAQMGRCVDLVKNEIAGDMGIAAIGAAQLTRNGYLADSAKIARNASTIILLLDKTPEEIEADGPECGNKKMYVKFNRNGPQHADGEYIDLQFTGGKILFEQAEKQHLPVSPF